MYLKIIYKPHITEKSEIVYTDKVSEEIRSDIELLNNLCEKFIRERFGNEAIFYIVRFVKTRPMDKKILKLTLKRKWFDMIKSGEKPEEYRDIKPYWIKRLVKNPKNFYGNSSHKFKDFTIVQFTNGYSKTSETFFIELKNIKIGYGRKDWGALPERPCFKLELGKIIKSI